MATIGIADLLTPARVIPQIRAADKCELLDALAMHLAAELGAFEGSTRRRCRCHRRSSAAHAKGRRLAVPHGCSGPNPADRGLRPASEALELGRIGDCDTDLVAFLVSPADTRGDHLRALASLARRLRRTDVSPICERQNAATSCISSSQATNGVLRK